MYKQTLLFGLAIGCIVAFHAALYAEADKSIPASLDEATTFEEIQAYLEHTRGESWKNLKTPEDQERFYATYPPVAIAGARKIIALGGDDKSLEYGYWILLFALDWSSRIHPESAKEFEKVVEEIKESGKFPALVDSARFIHFFQQSRFFEEKISTNELSTIKNEFDAMKEESKALVTLKQQRVDPFEPMMRVLDLAREISIANSNPRFFDDILEDLIRFVTSDRFERKKENEARLRGYSRQMIGSPFELWGKTVEGNDFHWADYAEKVVLVSFTASWCAPCRAEMPNIVEVYEKYHAKGLEVIFVGVRDTTDNLKKMVEEDKIGFAMISEELSEGDSRGLPHEYYGIRGVPEIFLVGKDGRIIATNLRGPTLRDGVEKQFLDKNETTP